ncbi:hypothetical protein [Vibrio bivalvicida]|uniref:Uncharacterized protein n=1 Tax=Vibrio bivalvicida TaxID=1276888 RepID=A0A177Y0A0_9VIBR|nr:hypothetical protein [Vibrio bivalvicida]OAJ94247.1 hypothetical protein APB76_10550 [Vibrio bivalvicida]
MNNAIEFISKGLFDDNFVSGGTRFVDRNWIQDNGLSVLIIMGGTEVMFEPVFSNLKKQYKKLFLCKEPKLGDIVDKDSVINMDFNNNLEYYEKLVSMDGLFFDNHLIFSNNLNVIIQIIDEEAIIVIGEANEISDVFSISIKESKSLLGEELGGFEKSDYADYYWGKFWFMN